MDIVSHLLIGEILGVTTQNNPKDVLIVTAFSVLPDLTQLVSPTFAHTTITFCNARSTSSAKA